MSKAMCVQSCLISEVKLDCVWLVLGCDSVVNIPTIIAYMSLPNAGAVHFELSYHRSTE